MTSLVFYLSFISASFCFDLFLVPIIHSMFDLWFSLSLLEFMFLKQSETCWCCAVNKFRIISDFSFAMSEPFNRGYVEWQKWMKDDCGDCGEGGGVEGVQLEVMSFPNVYF